MFSTDTVFNITYLPTAHKVFHIFSHKLRKQIIISIPTHLIVRATYYKFQSSTKIISQGNLISDGEIFFTVHTTVMQQTCRNLSFIQQSTHKTPQTAIQKTNEWNMVSGLRHDTCRRTGWRNTGWLEEGMQIVQKSLGQADLYKQGHKWWVFMAPTNCPTDGLSLRPRLQSKGTKLVLMHILI